MARAKNLWILRDNLAGVLCLPHDFHLIFFSLRYFDRLETFLGHAHVTIFVVIISNNTNRDGFFFWILTSK